MYRLRKSGIETEVLASGTLRATETDFHVDVEMRVNLNGQPFFHQSWLESVARRLM